MSAQKKPALHHQDRSVNTHTTQKFISDSTARRRQAAHRCEPLDCGCRDKWTCRCDDNPEPTPQLTEAAITAAEYLQHHGLPPIFSVAQGRALWRAGRRDLAVLVTTEVGQ